jgi:eukaryotic-like serine/threonine-protein kinase
VNESLDHVAVESDGADADFDDLIEVLTARLQALEPVDVDEVARRYPEYAERLRRVLPALVMMADFGDSSPRQFEGIVARGPGLCARVLGDFRILREVGRGGMGVVYEAQQISLDRRVALKILPLAAALDGKQLQRFQLEAHAAACLHHTNIVPVHAVGCEQGVPFYAMQFIEGRSLAQLITELRRLEGLDKAGQPVTGLANISTLTLAADIISKRIAGGTALPADREATASHGDEQNERRPATPVSSVEPSNPTPRSAGEASSGCSTRSGGYIRTVAQFGVQVALALDHAHTRGILHRDIKPANLLLDDKCQVWVTDFGLAQIQSNPGLSLSGDVLGTLRYMSPEQALGKRVVIDGRTDIYSLGVTLYELLTLRPVFDGKDRQEILRKIAQDDPAPPRKLNPAVRRDLESIVLKAMAKEPGGRYATMMELANELRRFLEDKPIKARRPTLLDRAAKWTRRHRPLVASATAATVSFLMLAVVVLGFSNLRIQKEKQRAAEQKQRAEANLRKAREVVDRMFTRVAQDLEHTPRMEKVRRALLLDALEFYQEFLKENGTNIALRYEAALAYIKVGDIHAVLAQYGLAVPAWRQAIALLEKLSSEFPQVPEYRESLAYCHGELGLGLSRRTHFDEGIQERRKEVALREKLAADFPTVPDYRRKLALAHTDLGNVIWPAGRAREAEHHYRQALIHWDKLRADFPGVPEDRKGLAHIHHWWGNLLFFTNRLPEAETEFRKVLALRERLVADEPGNSELKSLLAHIQDYLGQLLLRRSRLVEAEDQFRRSIKIYESLVEDFPDTLDFRRRLGLVYDNLSVPLRELGKVQEAEIVLRRAIDLRERRDTASDDPDDRPALSGWMYAELGSLYLDTGRAQEAADAFRRAQARYERGVTERPGIAWVQVEYALFLASCPAIQFQDTDRALKLTKQALQLSPEYYEGWRVLGLSECRAGHWTAAIEALERWVTFNPDRDPEAGFSFAIAHARLGHRQEALKRYDEAARLMKGRGPRHQEQSRLRVEAAELLGLPKPAAPAQKEVGRPAKG